MLLLFNLMHPDIWTIVHFAAWSANHAIENQQSMLTAHAYLFVRLCLSLKSLFSRLLSEVVFPVVQEAASRVRSSEEGTWPQGSVAVALTPTDAAHLTPESTRRWTDRWS